MNNIIEKLSAINWQTVTEQMNEKGFVGVSKLLSNEDCERLVGNYNQSNLYRKTITMERYRFGLGEYKYFHYPLPDLIQTIRENVYLHLTPIANGWMKMLNIDKEFPDTFDQLQKLCHCSNQTKPKVLILKYGKGGHNTLHQDLYGEVFSQFKLFCFLMNQTRITQEVNLF